MAAVAKSPIEQATVVMTNVAQPGFGFGIGVGGVVGGMTVNVVPS